MYLIPTDHPSKLPHTFFSLLLPLYWQTKPSLGMPMMQWQAVLLWAFFKCRMKVIGKQLRKQILWSYSYFDISTAVWSRGVVLDEELTFSEHVNLLRHASFYQVHKSWVISRYLSCNTALTLLHAFISCTSRINWIKTFYIVPSKWASNLTISSVFDMWHASLAACFPAYWI